MRVRVMGLGFTDWSGASSGRWALAWSGVMRRPGADTGARESGWTICPPAGRFSGPHEQKGFVVKRGLPAASDLAVRELDRHRVVGVARQVVKGMEDQVVARSDADEIEVVFAIVED